MPKVSQGKPIWKLLGTSLATPRCHESNETHRHWASTTCKPQSNRYDLFNKYDLFKGKKLFNWNGKAYLTNLTWLVSFVQASGGHHNPIKIIYSKKKICLRGPCHWEVSFGGQNGNLNFFNMLWSKTPPTRKSYSHDSGSHSKITPAPRKWGCGMLKNWCPYPDLSFQSILMILVSKFLYSCLVSRTIIKMEKMDKKGQKWPKNLNLGPNNILP